MTCGARGAAFFYLFIFIYLLLPFFIPSFIPSLPPSLQCASVARRAVAPHAATTPERL
jgi:hypothetical protein